jgi:DNA polymerase-3 subunit delta
VTFEELERELGAGRLRPAYLLAGPEPLLRDDALAAIRSASLGAGPPEFNVDRLEGANTTPDQLLAAVRTLPVMAPRRLVVLREPEAGRGGRALLDAVEAAVLELAAGEHGVLVVAAAKVDGRARWVTAFGEARLACEAPRRTRELVAFVEAEAARQGVALGPGAAQRLAERVGPLLLLLRNELAKAALLAGPGCRVTRAHVEAGAVDTAETPTWEVTDAVGEGRRADALDGLSRLLASGAPPPVVLSTLANHFRRLLRVRCGEAPDGPPFVRRKLEAQAARYSRKRLLACLAAIHDTDLALKGEGGVRPELALERLVLALA